MKFSFDKSFIVIFALIVIGFSTRFFFIWNEELSIPNFTAIGAVAIFGANYFKGGKRFIVPLIVLWLSDLILNNVIYSRYFDSFQLFGSGWVYIGFALVLVVGILLMRKPSWKNLSIACLGSGMVFYLITNLGVWLEPTSPYTKDLSGLIQSYINGLPFFRNTLLGNFVYGFALFGIYEFTASKVPSLQSNRSLV